MKKIGPYDREPQESPQDLSKIGKLIPAEQPVSPAHYHLEDVVVMPGSTRIGDCIQKMRSAKISSVLIGDDSGTIVGIFTERDPFFKIYTGSTSKPFTDFPVRLVMSQPVHSLTHELIHRAADMMQTLNIHHIPIIEPKDNGEVKILGMVTMEDIHRANLQSSKAWRDYLDSAEQGLVSIGILTGDRVLASKVSQVLKKEGKSIVKCLKKEDFVLPVSSALTTDSYSHFILDLDFIEPRKLVDVLKNLFKSVTTKRIILLFTPDKVKTDTLSFVRRLEGLHLLRILPKPIEATELVHNLASQQ